MNDKSKVVPDQTLSTREILRRYSKGLPISGSRNAPVYDDDDPELPRMGRDIRSLDLTELDELVKTNYQAVTDLQTKFRDEESKKIKEALRNEVRAEIEAELKATTQSTNLT